MKNEKGPFQSRALRQKPSLPIGKSTIAYSYNLSRGLSFL